jgi:MFS family permease
MLWSLDKADDVDSVATSLPTISRYFNDAGTSSWVGTSYLLTSTTVQPMYGRLSDIFGRKVVLLCCLVIFLFASLACALAHSMIQLIIFRAFQGIGGGGITTLGMIISGTCFCYALYCADLRRTVSDVVSLRDRGKYQGIMGGVTAVSNSLGPIIGGVLSEQVSWRWCFVSNMTSNTAHPSISTFP